MQAFIECIDIFPERRGDGNWIKNIKFQLPVPIIRDGKKLARVEGITLDGDNKDAPSISLKKLSTIKGCVSFYLLPV